MNPQIDDVSSQIAALRRDSRELFMIEFSEAAPEFELTEPPKTVVPHCWRWEDYYPPVAALGRDRRSAPGISALINVVQPRVVSQTLHDADPR